MCIHMLYAYVHSYIHLTVCIRIAAFVQHIYLLPMLRTPVPGQTRPMNSSKHSHVVRASGRDD